MAAFRRGRRRARTQGGLARRVLRALWQAVLVVAAVFGALVLVYRFAGPPTTLLIETERWRLGGIERNGVSISDLPPHVSLAFVGAEDARFCRHWGIDFDAVADAMEANAEGRSLRGGSTITQQVAKNVFLWPDRSWLRKGLEAGIALVIDVAWPKRRILEIYLNVAETGEGVFGVDAAAQVYFNRPAAKLSRRQAALIAAALPNPKERNPARPTAFLNRRAASIMSSAETLAVEGGDCVLD